MTQAVPWLWLAWMLLFRDALRLTFWHFSLSLFLSTRFESYIFDCFKRLYSLKLYSRAKILQSDLLASALRMYVSVCWLVAPPTEWACVALWLIPPFFGGLMEFNTQTQRIEYIMQTELQHWNQPNRFTSVAGNLLFEVSAWSMKKGLNRLLDVALTSMPVVYKKKKKNTMSISQKPWKSCTLVCPQEAECWLQPQQTSDSPSQSDMLFLL